MFTSNETATLPSAIEKLNQLSAVMEETIERKRNFEKLLEVQNTMVSMSIFGSDDIRSLVSTERWYVMDGDLIKVCRKKNKKFHFWLFGDLLMYGSSVSLESYQLHHSFPLEQVRAKAVETDQVSFQIHTPEKSFVVITENPEERDHWLTSIREFKVKLVGEEAVRKEEEAVAAAIWTSDEDAKSCSSCHADFTITRRRHHCRLDYL